MGTGPDELVRADTSRTPASIGGRLYTATVTMNVTVN